MKTRATVWQKPFFGEAPREESGRGSEIPGVKMVALNLLFALPPPIRGGDTGVGLIHTPSPLAVRKH